MLNGRDIYLYSVLITFDIFDLSFVLSTERLQHVGKPLQNYFYSNMYSYTYTKIQTEDINKFGIHHIDPLHL